MITKASILSALGSPTVVVDLNNDELDFCIAHSHKLVTNASAKINSPPFIRNLTTKGAVVLAKHIIAKKKFRRSVNYGWNMMTPVDDGFSQMITANEDWNKFLQRLDDLWSGRALGSGPIRLPHPLSKDFLKIWSEFK